MITSEDFLLLSSEQGHALVEQHKETPSHELAFKGLPRAVCSVVAQLSKCKKKLPDHYRVSAIVDDRAYQQCSSSATALAKEYSGASCLDLTMGLGVDSYYLSKRFDRVVSLEMYDLYAQIGCYNFSLLGADNIEVINTSAEEYLLNATERFDMIYVDPARRDDSSRKLLFEDCSPDILSLMDRIFAITDKLVIKASPLFDCDMAQRLFSGYGSLVISAVSYGGECKELLIEISSGVEERNLCGVTVISSSGDVCSFSSGYHNVRELAMVDDVNSARYLYIPDVAFYKMRRLDMSHAGGCEVSSADGVLLSRERVEVSGAGFKVLSVMDYQPAKLKRWLKSSGIKHATIYRKGSRTPGSDIKRSLGLKDGSAAHLVITSHHGRDILFHVEPL